MRCNRKRRGVSEIIGVLLMVAIVVSLGVLIFTFSSGGMYNLSESYATAMTAKQNAAEEKFQVEQVAFTFPTRPSTALARTRSREARPPSPRASRPPAPATWSWPT